MPPTSLHDLSEGAHVVEDDSYLMSSKADSSALALFRRLVPLVSSGKTTHLNAGFMPPSNLVVHEALGRFCAEALHHPNPKPVWKQVVEDLRDLTARYIKTPSSNIAFVRDTTEGLASFMHSLKFEPGDNVVILDCEHPNQAYGWLSLRPAGLEVRVVATIALAQETGRVEAADADTFAPYVDSRTRAIGLSSAMFHSGQLNDVSGICARYRPRGIHVLADLTQHVGFADVDVGGMGVSAAAFSMHKGLNTPIGIAVLYMDPQVLAELDPVPPMVGVRAVVDPKDGVLPEGPIDFHKSVRRFEHANMGWVNAVAGKAFMEFYLDTMGSKRVENHLYRLGDTLRSACGRLGVPVIGPTSRTKHSPHLYVLDLHDERWDDLMKEAGVVVTRLDAGIRVSFGFYNNSSDVDRFMEVVEMGLAKGIPCR